MEIVGTNIALALVMVVSGSLVHELGGSVDLAWLVLLLGANHCTILGRRATMLVADLGRRTIIALLIEASAIATLAKALGGTR